MNEWVTISLGTALYNAGVLGLYRLLEDSGAEKGTDYRLEGSGLALSSEYLKNCNLSQAYLRFLREWYGDLSRVKEFYQTDFSVADERLLDRFEKYWGNKTPYTVAELLKKNQVLAVSEHEELLEKTDELKKADKKDLTERRKRAAETAELLHRFPELYHNLLVADLSMIHLSNFFGSFAFLKRSQGNYLMNAEQAFDDALDEKIMKPLRDFYSGDHVKKRKGFTECMQCGADYHDKAFAQKAVFLNDFVDDMDKKTSTFWNQNADSYFCPVCALVYACMPFGFFAIGRDKMFVNDGETVSQLLRANNAARNQADGDRVKALQQVVQYELSQKGKELNNIEVVVRVNQDKRAYYSYEVVGKNILTVIQESNAELSRLSGTYFKSKTDYIDLFRECVNNLLSGKNQWLFLHRLLVEGYAYIPRLTDILTVQVNQNSVRRNRKMESNKTVYFAKVAGKKLKDGMTDADNKLRGYIYKLTNALGTDNPDAFMDTVVRMYGGLKQPIPDTLSRVYNEGEFKEVGYGYILGLKSEEKGE